MSYIVYHIALLPELLHDEKSYLEYLSTGEWFDRPQVNQKGNRNETERLLSGFRKQGNESGQFGLSETPREDLQHSRSEEPGREERNEAREIGANESGEEKILKVKRRGRPKKY
jgi:hypothetical protein